jgi:hypothetical protein
MSKKDDIPVFTEQTVEEALASQKDGFTEAVTSSPVVSATEAASITQAAEDKAKEEAEAAAKVAEEEASREVVPGFTAAALADALGKAKQFDSLKSSLDKVNGKFGSIEQTLKALQEAKTNNTVVQMTAEDVKDLEDEYGPELAGALLKSFNKFLPKMHGGEAKPAAVDTAADAAKIQAAIDAARVEVDEKLSKTTQNLELKLLNTQHKDWKKIVRAVDASGKDTGFNPEFLKWSATLPAEQQDLLLNTWDADFLSEKLTDFKGHLAAQEAAKKVTKNVSSNKLKAAITPQGVTGEAATRSALDEQKEGYASA